MRVVARSLAVSLLSVALAAPAVAQPAMSEPRAGGSAGSIVGTATGTAGSVLPGGALPDQAPRTGFERSGGTRWTTLAEETRFLRILDRDNRHVSLTRVGSSVRDRPLRLLRIGTPGGERPAGRHPARVTALFVCAQHGDEPAGREACLTEMRDLAYTNDPALRHFLRTTDMLFLPNANPDGREADTRENADGVDINRDHVALATPEGRAIATVIRDYRPDVVHDLHEYAPRPPNYVKDFLSLWPRNLNTADRVHDESRLLSERYARPRVERAGFSTGVYGFLTDPETGEPIRQIAGGSTERILRNASGIKHAVGLLTETRIDPLTEAEKRNPALNNRRRVDTHLEALHATRSMITQRRGRITLATRTARLDGLRDAGPVYFGGADNDPPAEEDVLDDPPCGYRLTGEQFGKVSSTLEAHGVRSRPDSGEARFVPMRQQARGLVPLLLDERAEYSLASGIAVPCR